MKEIREIGGKGRKGLLIRGENEIGRHRTRRRGKEGGKKRWKLKTKAMMWVIFSRLLKNRWLLNVKDAKKWFYSVNIRLMDLLILYKTKRNSAKVVDKIFTPIALDSVGYWKKCSGVSIVTLENYIRTPMLIIFATVKTNNVIYINKLKFQI